MTPLKFPAYILAGLVLIIALGLGSSQPTSIAAQEEAVEPDPIMIETIFAAMTPASADPHGDRMRSDCKSGARKC